MYKQNILNPNPSFGKLFDDLFNRSISDIVGADYTHETPAVNILESENDYQIQVAAPGLDKSIFDVSIEKDHLIISANTTEKTEEEKPTYKRREYNYAKFTRKFRLSEKADKETVKAKYELGILTITIDKSVEEKEKGPKSITID